MTGSGSRPRQPISASHALALLGIAAACLISTVPAAAASPAAGASPAASSGPTTFASTLYPYTIDLPPGWRGVPAEAGSDRDLFLSDRATGHANRAGSAPAGQTLADRVALRRADSATEGCTSDAAEDTSGTLGGEPAIMWRKHCPSYLAAVLSALHNGYGYGLTVEVPSDSSLDPATLVAQLAAGFRFTDLDTGSSSPSATPDLEAVAANLQGTWRTESAPQALWIASVQAAGLDPELGGWAADARTAGEERMTIRFQDGRLQQFESYDGGPDQLGWTGTYRVVGPHTIEATEIGTFDTITYDFDLRGNVLTVDVVSDADPVNLVPQTGIYETLPFTRVP